MLLILGSVMGVLSTAHCRNVIPDVLFTLLDRLLVCFLEEAVAQLDVGDQLVTSTLCEVLSHNDSKHLDAGVGSHGVSRDDPASRTEMMRQGELIVVSIRIAAFFGGLEAEGYERETGS
ncbi:hypothetical protein HG530_011329 [Fusarium avenaceum]|nr:hypothetical protein HG530_011329 [Fusarium avenaceum]